MLRKFTLLLPMDIFKDLQAEALKEKISVSDVVRDKILQSKNPRLGNTFKTEEAPIFAGFQKPAVENSAPPEQAKNQIPNIDFAILEALYLLREFLFERNAQIIKRVDDKMEKRFGKERKKIL